MVRSGSWLQLCQVALLGCGDCAVYDGRLLHCGTGNASPRLRAQLVATVRRRGADSVAPESRKTRRAWGDAQLPLEQWRKMGRTLKLEGDRAEVGRGRGWLQGRGRGRG